MASASGTYLDSPRACLWRCWLTGWHLHGHADIRRKKKRKKGEKKWLVHQILGQPAGVSMEVRLAETHLSVRRRRESVHCSNHLVTCLHRVVRAALSEPSSLYGTTVSLVCPTFRLCWIFIPLCPVVFLTAPFTRPTASVPIHNNN